MNGNARVLSTEQYPEVQFGKIILVGDMTQTGNNTINGYLTVGNTVSILATGVSDTGTALQISKGGIDLVRGAINNNYCCQMTNNSEIPVTNAFTKITGLSNGNGYGFDNALSNMCDVTNSEIQIQYAGIYLIHARLNAPNDGKTIAALTLDENYGQPITFKYHNANSFNTDQVIEMNVLKYLTVGQTIQLYAANDNFANIGGASEVLTTYLSAVLLN